MLRLVLMAMSLTLVSSWATAVSAQALKSVRLRVDPALFEYVKQNGGFEEPGDRSSTQGFGLLPSVLWVGVGISPNNNLNVGVSTVLGTSAGNAFSGMSSESRAIMLVPYAEYVSNGEALRGFLSVHAGLGGLFAADAPAGVSGALGASLGVRYFMDEYVSFDPHLRLLYTAIPTASETVKTFSVGIVFGVSFWLGNSKAPPIAAPPSQRPRSARLHGTVRDRQPLREDPAPTNAAPAPPPSTAAPTTPAAAEPVDASPTVDPAVAPTAAPTAPSAAPAPSTTPTTPSTPPAATSATPRPASPTP